jgi:hypothetical protein
MKKISEENQELSIILQIPKSSFWIVENKDTGI